MIRASILLILFLPAAATFAGESACSIEDIAGSYESQYGELACRQENDQLRCCYGNLRQCRKQLYLNLSGDGTELLGRWEYSSGSKGPAKFSVGENCSLGDGFWGSGAKATSAWTVGDRLNAAPTRTAQEQAPQPAIAKTPAPSAPATAPTPSLAPPAGFKCELAIVESVYETDQGTLDCEAYGEQLGCRFVDSANSCETTMYLTLNNDRRSLNGMALDSGARRDARVELDASCKIRTGFWKNRRGHFKRFNVVSAATRPPHADSTCTAQEVAKFYVAKRGEFACESNGNLVECCIPPPDPAIVPAWDCAALGALKLRVSGDRAEGQLVYLDRYANVSIPLDTRCHLSGGAVESCGIELPDQDLSFIYDPIRSGEDMTLAVNQVDAGMYLLSHRRELEAQEYFERAARQNNAEAQYQLGVLLEAYAGQPDLRRKTDIEQDVDRATELYALAAAAGHAGARVSLERRQEQKALFESILKQAKAGDAEKQYLVSRLYSAGKLVNEDKDEAIRWVESAAALNQPDALFIVSRTAARLARTVEERAAAYAEIRRAAQLGCEIAWVALANRAFYNDDDYEEAQRLLGLALRSGDALAIREARFAAYNINTIKARQDYEAWRNSPAGRRALMERLNAAAQQAQQNLTNDSLDVF